MSKFSKQQYFLFSFLLLEMIANTKSGPAIITNNWSEENSEEGVTSKTDTKINETPAPVVVVTVKPLLPIRPIKQTIVPSEPSGPDNLFEVGQSGDSSGDNSGEYYETSDTDSEEYKTYTYESVEQPEITDSPISSSESGETNTKKPVVGHLVNITYAAIPIKTQFIPVSGPKAEIGTVLKPAGFNGMKPVAKPKQVQSLPYESWADSPLSMAPKKKHT